jgi:hypothetical protein
LVKELANATADEMPALAADANAAVERIAACFADADSQQHLPPEVAERVRAEMVGLGAALRVHVAVILELRWAELADNVPSRTLH